MNFAYDDENDILTVEGIHYSGEFFRALANIPIGSVLRLESRIVNHVNIRVVKKPQKRQQLDVAEES